MGKGTIGARMVLEGESQYRAALKGIKTEQRELKSEMKLCQTTFRDNQNSLEALTKKHEILTKQVASQTEKIDVYKQAVEKASAMQTTAAKKMDELKTALTDAEAKMKEMSSSSDSTSDAIEEQKAHISGLKEELGKAETNYNSAGQKISYYQTCLNNAEAEMQGMQRELKTTEAYIKEAENASDQCATSIDEYGKETKEAADNTIAFGDVLKANLVSEAIVSGIKKLADGIKEIAEGAVDAGTSFEASMSQVAATMGMTAEQVRSGSKDYAILADAAKKCGKETMFSASEAGEALNYLALAGYDVQKSAETLPKVLDLAAAGGLDLAYASDLVTDSMAALNMETSQLDNYIDEMTRTSQKSNTSVAQLGEATLVCAGTVSLAQQSIETMNAELGILANNGIKGGEAGTKLRNIILSLSSPTETAAIAIKELGLETADSQGNMRDLNDILTDMNFAMEGMSSVEKTQIISRIFNKTDIAAVNALLKGTGEEYNNLYAEINNCSGAAAEMAATLNDNLKGKVTILKSALEGLGISAYEIFDDEMKGSVESATNAVGRLQDSIDNGELGISMRKLSKSLGELTEGAIDFGEDALPVVIDGLTWLIDNSDMVVAGVTGIAAANMQMKLVSPAIEAVTISWNAYKTANEGATISQWLLNAAMEANPAGILITAIVGLTAALGAYIFANKDNVYYIDETTRATKELVEESKELKESSEKAAADRKVSRESMETEAAYCRNLVAELKELQARTSLTADEQIRQKMIVDELNQAVPNLNLAIDSQTGKLNMSTEALEKNVDAMLEAAKVEAAREDLTRIAEDQYEAEKNLLKLNEQMEEQTIKTYEAQKEYNAALENSNEIYSDLEVYKATEKYVQAQKAQEDLQSQIDVTNESIKGFTTEYEQTLEYIADTEGWRGASAAVKGIEIAAGEAGDGFDQMSESVQSALSEMQTSLEETISGQIDLFSEFNGEMAMTTDELLANMQSQVDGIAQWADNLAILAEKGIDQGLLKKLEEMGPSGAGYVATFAEMTDDELKKANELWGESLSLSAEAAEKAVDSYVTAGEKAREGFDEGIANGSGEEAEESTLILSEEETEITRESYKEGGRSAAEGFKEGVEDSAEIIEETMRETGKAGLDAMNDVLEIEEHSKQTETTGKAVDTGLEMGVKEYTPNVVNAVSSLCAQVLLQTRSELQTSVFVDIGRQAGADRTGNRHTVWQKRCHKCCCGDVHSSG